MRTLCGIIFFTFYSITNCFAQQIVSDDIVRKTAFISPHQYVDLGMAGVPVFNQGVNHYCGFFAPSAVLDAIIAEQNNAQFSKNNDYIDQMCIISAGISVLEAANSGLLIKQGQCRNPRLPHPDTVDWRYSQNNLSLYPIEDYQKTFPKFLKKDDLASLTKSYPVIGANQLKNLHEYDLTAPNNDISKTLENIKKELKNGHRVLFGTALLYVTAHEEVDESDSGVDYGLFHLELNERDSGYSLYSCKESGFDYDNCKIYHEMLESEDPFKGKKIGPNKYIHIAAHEMIFTAYDEDAKIFKIRNSHGVGRGDYGDFYMTEDYAENMLFGALAIK